MYSRMLIPVDGSDTAERVLPYARLLARTLKIAVELLEVLHVSEPAARTAAEPAGPLNNRAALLEGSRAQYLGELAQTFPDVSVSCAVETGRPEDVIIARAATEKSTLIAMATHGRSGISRW